MNRATLAVLATALPAAVLALSSPVRAGLRAEQSRPPLLVVERAWSAAASAVLGLPAAPGGSAAEARALRIADRALLAALREAVAGAPARVTLERDGSGRYFVATTAPDALGEVLQAMRRVVAGPLPSRHLADAVEAIAREAAFRDGSPKSGFDSVFASILSDADAVPRRPAPGVRDSAWVVVGPGPRSSAADARGGDPPQPPGPALLRSRRRLAPREPLRIEVSADLVTTWVGSAYHFPSGTTLVQAHFLRLVLEGWIESLRDPSLYEFAAEIDSSGRLLVRFSASRGSAGAWEARLDEALAAVAAVAEGGSAEAGAAKPGAQRVATLMRRAQGVWSRRIADPGACARAAAEALLRGASAEEAKAWVATPPVSPSPASVAAAAKGLRLAARVLYGT